jgi:hypothetical protein
MLQKTCEIVGRENPRDIVLLASHTEVWVPIRFVLWIFCCTHPESPSMCVDCEPPPDWIISNFWSSKPWILIRNRTRVRIGTGTQPKRLNPDPE